MHLPPALADAIDQQLEHVSSSVLAKAVESLSARYRGDVHAPLTENERLAYLVTRMPATYAALRHVLAEAPLEINSALDLGAGPGSSAWAIRQQYAVPEIDCVEQDAPFIRMGKQVIEDAGRPFAIRWRHSDLRSFNDWTPRDLVVAAYSLGELDAAASGAVLRHAWAAASQALVLVEPGTPAGFARVREFRDLLIGAGAWIAAPCPHALACPMESGNWCHFAQRVERSAMHRRLKSGSLSWEDEKFSYLIATREQVARAGSRVVRHPQIQSGLISLELCSQSGLESRVVRRNDRDGFRRARKVRWGDAW